jgi:enamine deaminase RidA (YjgF/YER057c/UK114 family)
MFQFYALCSLLTMPERYINPPTLFPSLSHGFSQAVISRGGTTIYISGQTAWDAQKQLVGGRNLGAQTRQALRNLRAAVEAAGGMLADVVALRLYVVNYKPEDAAAVGEALRDFFPSEQAPATTWVGVAALAMEEFLIEIEAVAVLEESLE